jgi:hypothetical protein
MLVTEKHMLSPDVPLAVQLRWHRRLAYILIAASIFVLLIVRGGSNSGSSVPGTGTGQYQPLVWDSGKADCCKSQ